MIWAGRSRISTLLCKSGKPDMRLCANRASPTCVMSLFLHHALQRMLVFAGKVHDLRYLGLGHLVSEHPALADAVLVHMHHDSVGGLVVLVEESLQHMDHEFHGRVVVIQEQHAV